VFQDYFYSYRVHYSHDGKTHNKITGERQLASIDLNNFKWKPICEGIYYTPIAAQIGIRGDTGNGNSFGNSSTIAGSYEKL